MTSFATRPLTLLGASFMASLPALAQPPNDLCASAAPLVVHDITECPFLGTAGTTFGAVQDGPAPFCDPDGVFLDVWYNITTGNDSVINIFIQPGAQMTDWGIGVFEQCGGTQVYCGFAPVVTHDVTLSANTAYLVRVLTNTDYGDPGPYTVCVSSYPPPLVCDGAIVKTTTGETLVNVCKDGQQDSVTMQNFSTGSAGYHYYLTTPGDTILQLLGSPLLDADTLQVGTYRVRGLSADGMVLQDQPGLPIGGVQSSGSCVDLSDNYVELLVDLCSDLPEPPLPRAVVTVHPLPSEGLITLGGDLPHGPVDVTVMDLSGRMVMPMERSRVLRQYPVLDLRGLAPGTYVIVFQASGYAASARIVVQGE